MVKLKRQEITAEGRRREPEMAALHACRRWPLHPAGPHSTQPGHREVYDAAKARPRRNGTGAR